MAAKTFTESFESVDTNRCPVTQTPRALTPKMPLKILDPGRSKLTTIESKRIISVLDETILKVEVVSMFSYILKNLGDLSNVLGPDLTGAFREHLRLSVHMETSLSHLEEEGLLYKVTAKGVLFGTERPGSNFHLLVQGLKSSVRNIVRLFCANPVASQAVRCSAYDRKPTSALLISGLSELREFLFEKLLTTPVEEKEKLRFVQQIVYRDKKNTVAIAALEDELAAAIQNRDEEVFKKNVVIKELKTHLHNLAKFSESQTQRTRAEAEKLQKGELRASQAKCVKTQQELQQLRTQLNALVVENRESELGLRKKKYKVEMEIENWVQKYDGEMIEKQDEYEEIDAVYVVEKAQLEELRDKFALLDEEYSQIMEERRVKKAQKEKAEKELAILIRAATLIQALWKGYLVRSLLRTKRKKKGKGRRRR